MKNNDNNIREGYSIDDIRELLKKNSSVNDGFEYISVLIKFANEVQLGLVEFVIMV